MTQEESNSFAPDLSRQFDVLYNNITSNQAPGLNVLEKSIFMTKSLYQLLAEYFNHRTDVSNGGYDRSEKRQLDFSNLTKIVRINLSMISQSTIKIDDRSLLFNSIPDDALYMLNHTLVIPEFDENENSNTSQNEVITDSNETQQDNDSESEESDLEGSERDDTDTSSSEDNPVSSDNAEIGVLTTYNIIPLSYDSYAVAMRKPYKYPPKGCAWMLTSAEGKLEVIVKGVSSSQQPWYKLKYVKKPNPIILGNLSDFGSLEGETNVVPFEFSKEMYHEILERAVTLAKIAWQGGTATIVEAANRQNNQK